jgi:tRNA pseudouridine38-40 synthase
MTSSQLETRCFVHGLNYYLPDDIAVKQAFRVLPGFDVRRKALSREYHYNIINCATRSPLKKGFYAQVKQELDAEAMNEACRHLIGKRDFSSFAALTGPTGSTWRNIIQAEIIREGDIVVFRIKANAFLTHQVRNTAGPLIRVGLGQMTGHEFKGIIEARKRGLAQPTAPAKGLVLYKVNYARELKEESLE